MKRILIVAIWAFAASSLVLGQTTSRNKMTNTQDQAAEQVISMEKKAWELWKAGDKKGFAALLSDDFVNVDAHGISAKNENVKEIDNLIKHEYRLWDFDVRRFGANVFLIVYKAHLKGAYKGEEFEDDLYASSEWVRRGGKWLNVFYHETAARK